MWAEEQACPCLDLSSYTLLLPRLSLNGTVCQTDRRAQECDLVEDDQCRIGATESRYAAEAVLLEDRAQAGGQGDRLLLASRSRVRFAVPLVESPEARREGGAEGDRLVPPVDPQAGLASWGPLARVGRG